MFSSLRARLLLSYILLIGLTLCVVGAALVALLLNSPLLALQSYERLTGMAAGNAALLRDGPEHLDERLQAFADEQNIRVMHVSDEQIIFDSDGQLSGPMPDTMQLLPSRQQPANERILRGRYRDPEGRLWYYISLTPPSSQAVGQIILAVPRGRFLAAGSPLNDYLRPLFQAGLLSLCVSAGLALLISNSVAGPLRHLGRATRAIAGGDYSQRVPEAGPREVRELGAAFNEMADRVQRTQQTQVDFLANVTHDLKTPLTSIQGFAQAILDGLAADPRTAARVIHDEAGRMRRLVEDLLDLARIESGQTPMRREWVELDSLLAGIVEKLSLRADEEGITLSHHVERVPRITGDNDRLAQVFTNLLDNALTHTPSGGHVAISTRPLNGGVEIAVADTGKGIPPEDLIRIFERFYQADRSRARSGRKGTGLGLTICKEIVELHGGTIQAESGEGLGATFVVWLPLPRPQDETVASSARER